MNKRTTALCRELTLAIIDCEAHEDYIYGDVRIEPVLSHLDIGSSERLFALRVHPEIALVTNTIR